MDLKKKLNKSYRKAIREFSSEILKSCREAAEELADVQVVSLLLQSVIIPGLEVSGRTGAQKPHRLPWVGMSSPLMRWQLSGSFFGGTFSASSFSSACRQIFRLLPACSHAAYFQLFAVLSLAFF